MLTNSWILCCDVVCYLHHINEPQVAYICFNHILYGISQANTNSEHIYVCVCDSQVAIVFGFQWGC
jgi:hypothetical protein